jgi:hypothetical protein
MMRVLLALALLLPLSCGGVQRRVTDVKNCARIVSGDSYTHWLPRVRRILANPSWDQVRQELTALGLDVGLDFIWCVVARAQADEQALLGAEQGTEESERVVEHAERWLR